MLLAPHRQRRLPLTRSQEHKHKDTVIQIQIPFPLLASLNGVALFGESHDVALLSTDVADADCRVIWRDYHASVRLVLVAPVNYIHISLSIRIRTSYENN